MYSEAALSVGQVEVAVEGEEMKALCLFEMSGYACQTAECCTAVDLSLQQHICGNLIDLSHNL